LPRPAGGCGSHCGPPTSDTGRGRRCVTLLGFALGLSAALAIALGAPRVGLALLLVSRLMDGLDGAVARLTQPTDRGAFLDITLDFLFYAACRWRSRSRRPANALAAAVLLTAFIGTGSSFLACGAGRQARPDGIDIRTRACTTWAV
jgi:phosphatidylglycerophosphate synthase